MMENRYVKEEREKREKKEKKRGERGKTRNKAGAVLLFALVLIVAGFAGIKGYEILKDRAENRSTKPYPVEETKPDVHVAAEDATDETAPSRPLTAKERIGISITGDIDIEKLKSPLPALHGTYRMRDYDERKDIVYIFDSAVGVLNRQTFHIAQTDDDEWITTSARPAEDEFMVWTIVDGDKLKAQILQHDPVSGKYTYKKWGYSKESALDVPASGNTIYIDGKEYTKVSETRYPLWDKVNSRPTEEWELPSTFPELQGEYSRKSKKSMIEIVLLFDGTRTLTKHMFYLVSDGGKLLRKTSKPESEYQYLWSVEGKYIYRTLLFTSPVTGQVRLNLSSITGSGSKWDKHRFRYIDQDNIKIDGESYERIR